MRRLFLPAFLAGAAFTGGAEGDSSAVTFHRDVVPLLQKHCQGCHRPGEAAPMSFRTYGETRPWASAIKEAVVIRRMPPWFADPHVGQFANDRSLAAGEIQTFVRWAESGAAEGDPKDAPAPVSFEDGWNIGKPDLIVEMPEAFEVPAQGTIAYTYFVIPTGFTEDKWVQVAEVRPGNRRVVHHVIAFVREPGSKWLAGAKPGVPFVPAKGAGQMSGQWLVGYAPGTVPDLLDPGQARLVPAGSDIVLQMHYTATGKLEKDRTKVGFTFAKELPKQRVITLAASNHNFVIPPMAADHKVEAKITLGADMYLTGYLPHMHLRGKAFEYRIVYPDGRSEDLLRVPKYDFNWQLTYVPSHPVRLVKGTTIKCTAWYDNSPNNAANPDPKSEVRYGDQSWEEMMFGFFTVAFDPSLDPKSLVMQPRKPRQSGEASRAGE